MRYLTAHARCLKGKQIWLLPLDKAWGGQQSCKLKGTASMNCHRVKVKFVAVSHSVLLRCMCI
jgi:hypothetical protein